MWPPCWWGWCCCCCIPWCEGIGPGGARPGLAVRSGTDLPFSFLRPQQSILRVRECPVAVVFSRANFRHCMSLRRARVTTTSFGLVPLAVAENRPCYDVAAAAKPPCCCAALTGRRRRKKFAGAVPNETTTDRQHCRTFECFCCCCSSTSRDSANSSTQ